MVDVPNAVRLTFVFVGLGSKLEKCCTVSMTFDREGYNIYISGKKAQNVSCAQ